MNGNISKYQEALDGLVNVKENFVYHEGKMIQIKNIDYAKLLQELVDRATPIKPNRVICKTQISKYSIMIEHKVYCPICNTKISIEGNCCPNNDCRQAIDWSQDE